MCCDDLPGVEHVEYLYLVLSMLNVLVIIYMVLSILKVLVW
jgi:hypothetical protein